MPLPQEQTANDLNTAASATLTHAIFIVPILVVGLFIASLWTIDHYWRNLTVSWLATISVFYITATNYHGATLVQSAWLFALTSTLLSWSILLTPVQLLIKSAEEEDVTAQVDIILDPINCGLGRAEITADIIAVHGLGSNPRTTWVNAATGTHWLRDVLAQDFPKCRIAQVNHDTRWDAYSPIQSLRDYGNSLLQSISRLRVHAIEQERPLILIGHSFGGILIKKALTLAAERNDNLSLRSVASSTGAVFFFGTPHKGSTFSLLGTLSSHFSYWLGSRSVLLEFLTPSSSELLDLHESFLTHFRSVFICNFFETKPIGIGGIPLSLVVTKNSAVIDGHRSVPLATNHKMLQRFESAHDPNYVTFKSHLQEGLGVIVQKRTAKQRELDLTYTVPFRLKDATLCGEFIGRGKLLKEISGYFEQLPDVPRRRVLALQGLGGIGKTQLAIHYAVQSQDRYTAIFWTNGRTEAELRLSLAGLAEQIPLLQVLSPSGKVKKGNVGLDQAIDAVMKWCEQKTNTKWLLIIDNVDSQMKTVVGPQEGNDESYDIQKYIPSVNRGHILITTRLSRLCRLGVGINVKEMGEDEGLDLLSRASGRPTDEEGFRDIIKKLHGLPLALCHAGAYINEAGISAAKYLEHYSRKSSLLLEQEDSFTYEHGSISSSWEMSFAAVENRNSYAGKLLMLWAFLDSFDVWWGLFQSAMDNTNGLGVVKGSLQLWNTSQRDVTEDETETQPSGHLDWLSTIASDEAIFIGAVKALREFSLVESNIGVSDGFSIHPVVHEWSNGRQDTHLWHENLDRAITLVGRAVPLAHHQNFWVLSRRLTPVINHLIRAIKIADPLLLSAFDSMVGLAFHEFDRGKYKSASALYEIIIPGLENALGLEHPKTHLNIHNQAICYRELGEYEKSEAALRWRLEITTRVEGADAVPSLRIVYDLGRLCMVQDRASEAYDYFTQCLAGYLRTEPDSMRTFDTKRQLGLAGQQIGKLDEAHVLHQAVLEYFKKDLGPDHVLTLLAVRDMGVVYHRYGRLEEAVTWLRQALGSLESQTEPTHKYVLETLEDLGKVYEDMGWITLAEEAYVRALDGYNEDSIGVPGKKKDLQESVDRLRTTRGGTEQQ